MRIEINHNACIGCGMCKYIDEDTFDFDDKEYIVAKTNNITELTKEAANSCPVEAIKIIEEKDKN